MKNRYNRTLRSMLLIVLILASTLPPAGSAVAQGEMPPPRPVRPLPGSVADAFQDADGLWRARPGVTSVRNTAREAIGGPDDYGYVWDDSVLLNWIDATDGADAGLSGSSWNQRTGAIPLPFAFKYYDATYSAIYISASGYIAFMDSPEWTWPSQVRTPRPGTPNAVIAPFSTPFTLAESGTSSRVFFKTGGVTPNQFFVVQWNEMRVLGADNVVTFEVVLHENGDILFQYRTIDTGKGEGWHYCVYVGIEDAEGLDGLSYAAGCLPYAILSGAVKAIRFTRPMSTGRVKVTPKGQGRFTQAGGVETFEVTLYNNGELGADAYEVTVASAWPTELYLGGQILADTNGNGVPDTGLIAPGERRALTVQVQTPAFVNIADANTVTLTVRSALTPSWQRTALLRLSVPIPFAQIYEDRTDPGPRLALLGPDGVSRRKVTTTESWIDTMAVAGLPSGGYVLMWKDWLDERVLLRYAFVDKNGVLQAAPQTLTAITAGWFDALGIAVAPNGSIGLSWVQEQARVSDGRWEYNYNVFFAILNPSGAIILSPTNLTNNTGWGSWWESDAWKFYYDAQIAASLDNRFMVVWAVEGQTEDGWWEGDVFYALYSADGQTFRPPTSLGSLTQDEPGIPRLAPSRNGGFVLAYYRGAISLLRLSSDGAITAGPVTIVDMNTSPLALAQMSQGRFILMYYPFTYVILNETNLAVLAGPTIIQNPFALSDNSNPSIVADADNRVMVTWGEGDAGYRPYHFYALIDGSGAILTPPTPWLAARMPTDGTAPVVLSSNNGYGLARANSFAPASLTQTDVNVGASGLTSGLPGGAAALNIRVGNAGLTTAEGVQVTLELDVALTLTSATPQPNMSDTTSIHNGGIYTWSVPALHHLSQGLILVNVGLPTTSVGSRYPARISVTTSSPDANPNNNLVVTEVMVAEQVYLPVTQKTGE